LTGSGQGPMGGFCELSNEPVAAIKVGNFLTCWVAINFSKKAL